MNHQVKHADSVLYIAGIFLQKQSWVKWVDYDLLWVFIQWGCNGIWNQVTLYYARNWHILTAARKGEYFATPEVIMARSNEGLGGMSRIYHRLILERLIPKNWSDEIPPIILNTWEAKYFHVNHDNVVDLANKVCNIHLVHCLEFKYFLFRLQELV
jgi:hypothetical protein